MKQKTIYGVVLFALMMAGCSNSQDSDSNLSQSSSPFECLSFVDSAVESYAMTWWDTNKDHCIDSVEANAVTQIPALAFVNNTQIQSLDDLNQFPNLTTIGNGAFSGCTNLVSANLSNVTTIGNSAFAGCTSLTIVNAPNATNIGDAAFSGCSSLTTVNVPEQIPPATQCTNGARKCSDTGSQSLVCANSIWTILDNCSNGCKDGVCLPGSTVSLCTEGELKCSDSGSLVIVCQSGNWGYKESCVNGCSNGVCKSGPHIVCPPQCKDNCDENGLCNDIVSPTCPSTCKNGCDDEGNCKPDEVTCPSTCKNGCDDVGNCKPDEVICPSTCKNGCDDEGNCNPDEVICPSTCKNGCDDAGNCKPDEVTCPSTCKNGCDDAGNCKPDEVTCPSSCINGCDDDGNCKPDEVTCPSSCKNGCDNAGIQCLCPERCHDGCDVNGGCLDKGDANGNHMLDKYETHVLQGKTCRTYSDCDSAPGKNDGFCDSFIGYKCSTKCTSDAQCIGKYGDYNFVCRDDGRCTPDQFVSVWEIPNDDTYMEWPFDAGMNQYLLYVAGDNTVNYHFYTDLAQPVEPCTIDWGDGTVSQPTFKCFEADDVGWSTPHCEYNDFSHQYNTGGKYTIKTNCNFLQEFWWDHTWEPIDSTENVLYFYSGGAKQIKYMNRLIEIKSFGKNKFSYPDGTCNNITHNGDNISCQLTGKESSSMFMYANHLSKISTIDIPNSNITSMGSWFYEAASFNQSLDHWDVSRINSFFDTFAFATSFNQSLVHWDVSSVTTAYDMFYEASSFNQDLSSWDMSRSDINAEGMLWHSGMNQENYCKIKNSATWSSGAKKKLGMNYTCQ